MLTETTRRFGKGLIRRWTLAAALALFAAATLITAAPNAQAQQAPGSVDSVTLTRSDGSITASWNAPAGATKYHVTYNDGTGWHAPVDDHRNIQSTSITFSADNAKTYVVGVRAGNDNGQWSGWVNSPAAGPYTPPSNNPPSNNPPATAPGPVSSITLTRADGSITADWDAPSDATHYHVTYNDGTGWHAPVDDHRNITTNSLTFNADNAKTYIVGVRAGNDVGWSGWRNSPSAGPYTPPTPEPTSAPVIEPTSTPEPTPPDRPNAVTVTREYGANKSITATWDAVAEATSYHVASSVDNGETWSREATYHTSTSITITKGVRDFYTFIIAVRAVNDAGQSDWRDSEPSGPSEGPPPVFRFTASRANGSLSANWEAAGADKFDVMYRATGGRSPWIDAATAHAETSITISGVDNAKTYVIAVRAGNDVGWSEWRNSAELAALLPPAAPTGLTATAGNGSVTLSWNDPSDSSITGYEYNVNHNDTSSGNLSGWSAWTAIAGSNSSTTSHTFTGLTNGKEYRYHLRAVNAGGSSIGAPNAAPWFASATPQAPSPVLTVEGATSSTLLLDLSNHSGAWSYTASMQTSGASASTTACHGPVTGAETTVTNLESNREYLITAYAGASCAGDAIASYQEATMPTPPPAPSTDAYVGNLDRTAIPMYHCAVGSFSYTEHNACAQGFTTGDAAHGYTLQSVTVPFYKSVGSPTALTVALHTADSGGSPSAAAQVTLSGSTSPNAAGLYTYTCSATTGCDLERNADYSIVMSTASHTGGRFDFYRWQVTASTDETVNPAGSGWALGNIAKWNEKNTVWLDHPFGDIMMMRVAADEQAAPLAGADNFAIDPGNGYLDLSWNAIDGATAYDIRAKESGAANWHSVANKVTGTSYRYTTDKKIDYVAVRGVSASSVGPWVELSRIPPDDFMNVASGAAASGGGASASASGGAAIAAATPPPNPSDSRYTAPTLSNILRDTYRLKARINVTYTGDGSSGVLGENFVCSDTDGWYWHPCGWVKSDGSISYDTVPIRDKVQIVSYRRGDESPYENGDYKLIRSRKYHIAARSVSSDDTKSSAWTLSEILNPVYAFLRDFTWTRTAGQIAMTWTPNYWTTGYEFDCDTYDPNVTYNPAFTRCGALTNQDDTANKHTITLSTWTANSKSYSIDDTKAYDIRICSTHSTARDCWLAPIIWPNPSLTASGVTGTTATLTINHHSAAWWYKANTGPDATCQSVSAGTSSDSLTGLTAGTVYVYTAYSKSGCNDADLIATTTFGTTQSVSVSNLSEATGTTAFPLGPNGAYAQEFTTGGATGGYTLSSVKIAIDTVFNASAVTVAIHNRQSNGQPETTARATLTGTPARGEVTFTCTAGSNNNCALDASTSYFVYLSASSANAAYLSTTQGDGQTLSPTGNGWSIADAARSGGHGWILYPDGAAMKMSVSATGGAASASLTATATTLTIANYTGSWHYQANTGPHATCQGPVTGTSQTISGLTGGASYTYKAYADSACTTANLLATAPQFTAPYSAPGAPTGLGRTGWDLSWTAPSDTGNGSGGITRYEVQCRRALNTTTTNTLTGNPPATYATLTHQHCKNYSTHGNFARVRAFNNIWGAYSDWFRLQ